MKRIYLLGYFHAGAYADDIIESITKKLFLEVDPNLIIMDKKSHPFSTSGPQVAEFFNKNCDLVVFCGGSLLGRLKLFPFNKIEKWIDKLEVPLVVLGTGWREETKPLTLIERRRMDLLLEKASYIGVRGNYSKWQILRQLPLAEEAKIEVLGDPGLCYRPDISNKKWAELKYNDNRLKVGIVVRNMSEVEIEQSFLTISNEQFYDKIAKIIDYMIEERNAKVYFFSFAEYNRKNDNDRMAYEKLEKLIKHTNQGLFVFQRFSDPDMLGASMGQMNTVISQRLHGTLLSLVQGVPCYLIEYQFSKLADSLSVLSEERFKINEMQYISLENFLNNEKYIMNSILIPEDFSKVKEKYIRRIKDILEVEG